MIRHAIAAPTETSPTTTTRLTRGDVVALDGPRHVVVRVGPQDELRVELALAVAYEPVVGDELLVIREGGAGYVIGVLAGQGRATLVVPGDLDIRSVTGRVRIQGGAGVDVEAPEISLHADALRIVARGASAVYDSVRTTVRDLWHLHAKRQHTLVDTSANIQAESAALVTQKDVTINGKAVHLG